MMKKLFKIIVLGCLAIVILVVAHTAFADNAATTSTYTLLAPIPTANGATTSVSSTNIGSYIQVLLELFVSLAAVIAVFMIVYGGILTMSTDNFENKKDGKAIIQRTLMGFLLLIVAYLILHTINPKLLNLDAFSNFPSFATQAAPTSLAANCQNPSTPTTPPNSWYISEGNPAGTCNGQPFKSITFSSPYLASTDSSGNAVSAQANCQTGLSQLSSDLQANSVCVPVQTVSTTAPTKTYSGTLFVYKISFGSTSNLLKYQLVNPPGDVVVNGDFSEDNCKTDLENAESHYQPPTLLGVSEYSYYFAGRCDDGTGNVVTEFDTRT